MNPQFKRALVGLAAITLVAGASTQGVAAVRQSDEPTESEKRNLRAGAQLAPKGTKAPTTVVDGKLVALPNPYLANTPDATQTDWAYWRSRGNALSKQRAKSPRLAAAKTAAAGRALPSPLLHDELEPETLGGTNDRQSDAEPINGFGSGPRQNPRLRILGNFPDLRPIITTIPTGAEDNGSIPLASATGIGEGDRKAITSTGVLGDGPHGPTGTGKNDFDVYKLTSKRGDTIIASTVGTEMDTVAAIYNSNGTLVAFNDDIPGTLASRAEFDVPADGNYYVLIGGFSFDGPLPNDPNDSGSGNGGADTGDYTLAVSSAVVDKDFYAVKLRKGDVLGGSVKGEASKLVVHRVDGVQAHGSEQDASFLYPVTSPLPAGGNAVISYVAEEPGWYAVSLHKGIGAYDATVEVYRPGTETDTKPQTIFLDFDGQRVNTAIFGVPNAGVKELSPFSAFIARWGLPRSAENALINRIVANVTENVRRDAIAKGLNPDVAVRILNSRDHADPFGQENVARVIIGGTIAESGINTIGIAQYIDPGNFGHEDTALVLLDVLSNPTGSASANTYLRPESDRIGFVSQVVGNVTSHEIGHFLGSYHVDQFNDVFNLMDQGGNPALMFGVGPDKIGGTADDIDVDFGEDIYNPNEDFTGTEDTLNVTAWAITRPRG